jgi:hypothetical protein
MLLIKMPHACQCTVMNMRIGTGVLLAVVAGAAGHAVKQDLSGICGRAPLQDRIVGKCASITNSERYATVL